MTAYPYNANIAFEQNGDALLLGSQTASATRTPYQQLRALLGEVARFDDFLGDDVSTNWGIDGTGTLAVSSPTTLNGLANLTTSSTNNEFGTVTLGLHWKATSGGLYAETRIANTSAITLRAIEFGFSDAISETNGLAFSSHDATPVAVATDACVFGYNTGDSMTTWSCLSVKNGGTPQYLSAGATNAPVAGTYQKLSVLVSDNGDASFYINDILITTFSNAVTTTVGLTVWLTLKTLSAAAKTVSVDYLSVSGSRS